MSWWSNYKLLYQRQSSIRIPKDDTRGSCIPKVLRALIFKAHRIPRFSEFINYKEPYRICEKRNKWLQKKNYSIKGLRHFMKNVYRFNIFPFCIFFHVFPCCKYCFFFQPMLKRISFQMEQKNLIYLWIFFTGSIIDIF